MNSSVTGPNYYQIRFLEKQSGVSEKDIVMISPHLTNLIDSGNLMDVVDHILIRFLSNKNIKVFFNHQSEGLQIVFLQYANQVIDVVMKKCGIALSQFNVISGAVPCSRLINSYKKLCSEYNLHILNLWIDNYWEIVNVGNKLQPFKIDFNPKSKRILCFNGVPRIHRAASILEMYKRNIIDKAYISIGGTIEETMLSEMVRMFDMDIIEGYAEILEKHKQEFPMKLTLADDISNAYHINDDDRKLFNDTVVSLVNETQFSSRCAIKHRFSDGLTYPGPIS